jgi:hypothetical protein
MVSHGSHDLNMPRIRPWSFGLRLVLFGNEAQGSASGSQKTKHTQALTTHESQESLLRCSTL